MKAIFTTVTWAEVEDYDMATQLVLDIDKGNRLSLEAVAERNNLNLDDLIGEVGYCGTSFWIVDESRIIS